MNTRLQQILFNHRNLVMKFDLQLMSQERWKTTNFRMEYDNSLIFHIFFYHYLESIIVLILI